jgi:hypothetical protein
MGIEIGQLFQGVGAGVQAVGAYNQAKGEQAALRAQAQVEANNAQLSEWQAQDAIARGDMAAGEVIQRGAQIKGSQRAAFAANGVDLGYGSALEIITDTDYLTAVDASQVQNNAAREAWGYRVQADQATDRARAATNGANQVRPWLSAGTSLLTSATAASRTWYGGNKSGGAGADGFSDWAFRSNRGMGG